MPGQKLRLLLKSAFCLFSPAENRYNFGEPGFAVYTKKFNCFLLAEDLFLKRQIDATLSPLGISNNLSWHLNTSVTNLAITMFYHLQNASFMHISSPINAIEDVYITLGHFLK